MRPLRPARTRLQIHADRRAADMRRALAQEAYRLRSDTGLGQASVARAAGISTTHLSALEAGRVDASLNVFARVAAVLGADLIVRLYPNSGPAIHDRIQARIGEALATLVKAAGPRWRLYPEVPVRTPTRGRLDFVLFDAVAGVAVATEIESGLRRIEQLIGWHRLKAEALPSSPIWPELSEGDRNPSVDRLLLVRSTRETPSIAEQLEATLRSAYPASSRELLAALAGEGPWPGGGILWVSVRGNRVSFEPRPRD